MISLTPVRILLLTLTTFSSVQLLQGGSDSPLERLLADTSFRPIVDSSASSPCGAALMMAWSAHLSLGCEEAPLAANRHRHSGASDDLTGMTVAAAFDILIARYTSYRWYIDGSVIAVRPREHLTPDTLIDLKVRATTITGSEGLTTLHDVVAGLFGTPPLQEPVRGTIEPRPINLDFPGGTLGDLLNAMAAAYGSQLSWHIARAWPHEPNKRLTNQVYIGFELPAGGGIGWLVPHTSDRIHK